MSCQWKLRWISQLECPSDKRYKTFCPTYHPAATNEEQVMLAHRAAHDYRQKLIREGEIVEGKKRRSHEEDDGDDDTEQIVKTKMETMKILSSQNYEQYKEHVILFDFAQTF